MKKILIACKSDEFGSCADMIREEINKMGEFIFMTPEATELATIYSREKFDLYLIEAQVIGPENFEQIFFSLPTEKLIILRSDGMLSENHLKTQGIPHTMGSILTRDGIRKLETIINKIIQITKK